MASLFDSIRSYINEWKEIEVHRLTEEECTMIIEANVVSRGWGYSVELLKTNGEKEYIQFEPSSRIDVGMTLDPAYLEVVTLQYLGNNPGITIKIIKRVRVIPKRYKASNYENPFNDGLKHISYVEEL